MKKTYTTPETAIVELCHREQLLNGSLVVEKDTEATVNGSDVLTNKKGAWDSEQWKGEE